MINNKVHLTQLTEKQWDEIKKKSDSIVEPFSKLFKINCLKCSSDNVEIFGDYDESGCYYSGERGNTVFVIKCHSCGNAKAYTNYSLYKKNIIDE